MFNYQLAQRTVQCTACTQAHGVPPYVDLSAEPAPSTFQPTRTATHCPRCGRTRQFRPYDYADVLCQDYLGLTRQAAIQALALFNDLRTTELATTKATSQARHAYDIFDYLNQRGIRRMIQRGYISPLDCTCKSCGGQFTLLRGIIDIQQTPPIYCVWCGKVNQLITDSTQNEDTAWLVLSSNYKLPIPVLKALYTHWSSQSRAGTPTASFADYIQTQEVQQLLPMLAQA